MDAKERARGAGGNRTPVHQARTARATTIPAFGADATPPPGRLPSRGGPRAVFPACQRSSTPPVVFPTVIFRFCCRAADDRPRAALRLTMSLMSPEDQAARANCSLAILVGAPFSESEQLGSHARPAKLMSKPISPVDVAMYEPLYRDRAPAVWAYAMPLRWRPSAFATSALASRSAMAWRWSPLVRPLASASSTLARPSLK